MTVTRKIYWIILFLHTLAGPVIAGLVTELVFFVLNGGNISALLTGMFLYNSLILGFLPALFSGHYLAAKASSKETFYPGGYYTTALGSAYIIILLLAGLSQSTETILVVPLFMIWIFFNVFIVLKIFRFFLEKTAYSLNTYIEA